MKRRNFLQLMGASAAIFSFSSPLFSDFTNKQTIRVYDHEPPIWGSPYHADTQSIMEIRGASYEEIQKDMAHFHMSERPRDVYLFDLSY